MTNQVALVVAMIILAAIGWDVFLNDAFWITTWARRLLLIVEALAIWR